MLGNELDRLFNGAIIYGKSGIKFIVIYYPKDIFWSLEVCFNQIKTYGGGVDRIDISKTPLQRILNNANWGSMGRIS